MDRTVILEKVRKLMSEMSLEEKVLQLTSVLKMDLSNPETMGIEDGIGCMPVMGGTPEEIAQNVRKIQDYVLSHSKHKIPVLFHCETLAGPLIAGGNLFPVSISLGASFCPEIVEEMARINGRQMRAVGIRHGLSPVVDIVRDMRWGRIGETYGADPTLCGIMGTAFVKGLQGDDSNYGVAATLKHMLGYGASMGGLNMTKVNVDYRDLRENFAKPFEMVIRDGGVKAVMNSYNEYNGKAICANKEILTDLLRDDLGFDSVVVSDYSSVERVHRVFCNSDTFTEAGEQCLSAGLDVELPNRVGYSKEMVRHAEEGLFDPAYIDRAVERVLILKYELGLFDHPYPNIEDLSAAFDHKKHNEKSYQATLKTMTLTKNNGILPIKDTRKKLAVIGPMGHAVRAFYACYTLPASLEMMIKGESAMAGVETSEEMASGLVINEMDLHIADDMIRALCPDVRTTYEALADIFDNVVWVEGCDYIGDVKNDFDGAIAAAKDADYVIMGVGGRNGWGTYCTSGEGADSTHIGLPGNQEELIKKVFSVNPNMVVVHTDCRPLVSEWVYEHVPAVLEAWLPCTYGGIAIAQTIIGENNPGGRLQMDVPRSSSHGPVGYNFYRGTEYRTFGELSINKEGYLDINMKPRLPFGHGLSYTTFEYSDFDIQMDEDFNIQVFVDVENTGDYAGDEVVQLYGRDLIASIVRPDKELIGFKRISLDAGEKKRVQFSFSADIMAFYDEPGHWILEKGELEFYIGRNSEEKVFSGQVNIDSTIEIDHSKRCLSAEPCEMPV